MVSPINVLAFLDNYFEEQMPVSESGLFWICFAVHLKSNIHNVICLHLIYKLQSVYYKLHSHNCVAYDVSKSP